MNPTIEDKISDPGMLRGDSIIFKFQSQLISDANGTLNPLSPAALKTFLSLYP